MVLGGFLPSGIAYHTPFKLNLKILYIAIPLILPYFIYSVNKRFLKKNEREILIDKVKSEIDNGAIFGGEKIEINFNKNVVDMIEQRVDRNDFLGLLDDLHFRRWYFPKMTFDLYTIVKIKYRIDGKNYYKKLMFPFSLENTKTFLKMNATTNLYYDRENIEDVEVDLRFLKDYL